MRILALWGTVALLAFRLIPVYAQENVTVPPTVNGGTVPRSGGKVRWITRGTADGTLASILERIDWDASERGPLLIVAPELAREVSSETDNSFAESYRLKTLAPRYNRKMIDAGNLTAVVPATMAVLNYDRLPEPNVFSGENAYTIIPLLLATLDKSQWQQLMSPSGLGMSDLTKDQADILAVLIPADSRIQRTMPGGVGSAFPKMDSVEMTREQRNGIRLCLYQQLSWYFITKTASGASGFFSTGAPEQEAAAGVTTYRFIPAQITDRRQQHSGYGVELWQERENRIKPGDIDYDATALNHVISLTDISTVGDLIKRIREETHIEIYCDPHYAGLTIYHRGESARAGDLLKALALSVTGTYRKVADGNGKAYVLTDDLVGLGARHLRIYNFLQAGAAELGAYFKKAEDAIKDSNASSVASWSEEGPYAVPQSLREKMHTKQGKGGVEGVDIPLSEMPASAQAIARYQLELKKKRSQDGSTNQSGLNIDPDKVHARSQLQLGVLVPGLGTVPINNYNLENLRFMMHGAALNSNRSLVNSNASKSFSLSKGRAPERGLLVSVSSADEAAQWARLAGEKGYNRLLLKVYSDAEGSAVKKWITAAKAAAPMVEVYLQIAVLRSNPTSQSGVPAANLERNQLGETALQLAQRHVVEEKRLAQKALREHMTIPMSTGVSGSWKEDTRQGELLSPMVSEVATGLASRIADIVHTSGASGVVLTDLTLPGTDRYRGYVNDRYYDDPGRNFGYTPSARLAFLREKGSDPIDFSLTGGDYGTSGTLNVNLTLPFFSIPRSNVPNQPSGFSDWTDYQKKQVTQLREEILTSLQGAGIAHVFLESEAQPANVEVAASDLEKWIPSSDRQLIGTWELDRQKVAYLYPFRFRDVSSSGLPASMPVSEQFARLAFGQLAGYMNFVKPGEPMDPSMLRDRGGFLMDFTGQTPGEGRELLQNITIVP